LLITGNRVHDNMNVGIVGGQVGGPIGLMDGNVMSGNVGGSFIRARSTGHNVCNGDLC
jgi:hypothetical protein